MRRSGEVLRKVGVIDPQTFADRIAGFLRSVHPNKTALYVSVDTGISAKTVAKWLEGVSSPSGGAYHRLIESYGPELFVHVSPDASPASLREAARVSAQARLERRASAIRMQLADLREGRA